MIVDYESDVTTCLQLIAESKTLLVPIYSNPIHHTSVQDVCAIYVFCENNGEWLIPIHHTEQIRGFSEYLKQFLSLDNIFIHDKKRWLQTGGNDAVWDVKTLWWYTYNEAYDESHYPSASHEFYWRRMRSLSQVNAVIPMQQHLAMCQKIRHYAWPMCMNAKLTDSYLQFNELYPKTFAAIESNGLAVNNQFKFPEQIQNNRVYSQYNYHTTTGRPSNAFGGFNYAAMNKEDGTRAAFCSRHKQGALVEMDFDSYHVRLIAKLINYDLPETSIHDYLGQFYFGVDQLTDEQRNESKSITFRLLYGGIDKEFLSIPFFRQVNDFVFNLWRKWKQSGCIKTPIINRSICKDQVTNMTSFKLFNYYLQATETEVSVKKLALLQDYLQDFETCIILYTYDSVMLDVPLSEAKSILPEIKNLLEQGKFPVKCKVGDIYDKMKTITL
tara:strand:+ start:1367 stop:2689 length:1323 start_codon:yes stop_codon:yes gene_type:complete